MPEVTELVRGGPNIYTWFSLIREFEPAWGNGRRSLLNTFKLNGIRGRRGRTQSNGQTEISRGTAKGWTPPPASSGWPSGLSLMLESTNRAQTAVCLHR